MQPSRIVFGVTERLDLRIVSVRFVVIVFIYMYVHTFVLGKSNWYLLWVKCAVLLSCLILTHNCPDEDRFKQYENEKGLIQCWDSISAEFMSVGDQFKIQFKQNF